MRTLKEKKETRVEGTRWSGADWADQQTKISIIGAGGIGSWLTLCLSRIEHQIYLIDGDRVDETNVKGGQMFKYQDIGQHKVNSVQRICREFGCTNSIMACSYRFSEGVGTTPITVAAVDNMAARKEIFEVWLKNMEDLNKFETLNDSPLTPGLFVDGRLLLENMEILAVQYGNEAQIKKYRDEYLFSDEEVEELDCTAKQSTFSAMTIAGLMSATICNWLTNNKIGTDLRSVPFYQRMYLPIFDNKQINIEENGSKETV